MMILKQLKYLFVLLLTFLLGTQTTYAKTELVLPTKSISFSIEQSQSFNSLEKEVQPNIGFLKEKTKFVVFEGISAQNQHKFSEYFVGKLANGVDDVLLASLKTKYAGKTKVLNWLDEVTDNAILTKLDDLPTSSITKMEDDILALKSHFNSNPSSINSWGRLIEAPDAIRKNIDILEDVSTWPTSWKIQSGNVNGTIEIFDGANNPLARIYSDRIVASGRSVTGQPGNKILNRVPPVKNFTYEVDGIEYVTDNLGRVTKTTGDLDNAVRVRLGNQQIRAVDVKDGVRGSDQGGHIVGARFYGAGEQINYYPQSANLNQGAWKTMENKWADEMVNGKDVKIQVKAEFVGNSLRPNKFTVDYTIDGQPFRETFTNQ